MFLVKLFTLIFFLKYYIISTFEIDRVTNNSLNENCQNKNLSYFFYSKNCNELHSGANDIDECYLKALVLKANSYWLIRMTI